MAGCAEDGQAIHVHATLLYSAPVMFMKVCFLIAMQVTDISTFTDDKKRAEVDAWLYETCTQCLQHIIDITVKFYPVVQPLLGRVLELLLNFIRSASLCVL